jgi:hypothetical protein
VSLNNEHNRGKTINVRMQEACLSVKTDSLL